MTVCSKTQAHQRPVEPICPSFLLLQWQITERCNLRCSHCYQEHPPPEDLPAEILETFYRQYLAFLASRGIRGQITLSGGEPLIREDFFELLDRLRSRSPRLQIALLTNGTLIDASVAAKLARQNLRFVQVSLDGDEDGHDAIRGKGAYACAVAGIRYLKEKRIPTLISFTVHKGNADLFPFVVKVGRRYRVRRVWADRMLPWGRGAHLAGGFLDAESTRCFFEAMRHEQRRAARALFGGRTEVAMHRALQFLKGGHPYQCTAANTLVSLQPNGDLLPCRRMPVVAGNLLHTPLEALYTSSPLLRRLRNPAVVSSGCEGCRHFSVCRGGLRCLSNAVYGDPFIRDPGCWLTDSERFSVGK